MAGIASFLIGGWGQVYNGESWLKGWLWLLGRLIGTLAFIVPGIILALYDCYTAYSVALRMKSGQLPLKEVTTLGFWGYGIVTLILTVILWVMAAAFIGGMAGSM